MRFSVAAAAATCVLALVVVCALVTYIPRSSNAIHSDVESLLSVVRIPSAEHESSVELATPVLLSSTLPQPTKQTTRLAGKIKSSSLVSLDSFAASSPCSASLSGGDGFIQIGNWRFGRVDDNHFSFSSNNGRTAVILRSDGTVHGGHGQRTDWGLAHKPITWTYSASNPTALRNLPNVQFGSSWVQFGPNCRLGTPDNHHLSVSFRTPCCGQTGIHTAGNTL
jgi:hypothetical protein